MPRQPRALGRLRVSSKARGGRSVLDDLYQSGASKALLPRVSGPALTAVSLNTAGGITGGDRFDATVSAGEHSRLTVTTQAAERIYRAQPGEIGRMSTRLSVADGARIDWLPQETILFDHCAFERRLSAEITGNGRLLLVEPVLAGRRASREEVRTARFSDRYEIRRDGELVFADATRLTGDVAGHLDERFIAGGARAFASIVYVADDAESFLAPLKELMPERGGISLIRPGVLFARLLAPDGYLLRQSLVPVIERLQDAPIPRTWTI